MLVNDDIFVRTLHWDVKIRNLQSKFHDKIYLAYPNDLNKKNKLSTFPIISKTTAFKLIKPYPEQYQGAFIDLHLYDVFKRLEKAKLKRIIYLEDIVFEHLHFRTGKSSFDETYKNRNRFEDDNTFHNLTNLRKFQSEKLINDNYKDTFNLRNQNIKKNIFFVKKLIHIVLYTFDKNLPFKWGLYLTIYFIMRNIYKFILNK